MAKINFLGVFIVIHGHAHSQSSNKSASAQVAQSQQRPNKALCAFSFQHLDCKQVTFSCLVSITVFAFWCFLLISLF